MPASSSCYENETQWHTQVTGPNTPPRMVVTERRPDLDLETEKEPQDSKGPLWNAKGPPTGKDTHPSDPDKDYVTSLAVKPPTT